MAVNNQLNTSGVPIPVDAGGTGTTSFTAYNIICGGTTATADLQNVASLGTAGQFLQSGGASALPSYVNIPTNRLLGFQYLTSGTAATYTPTSSTVNNILVECVGGGGGGGGCTGASSNYAAAGGGASGCYLRKWITNIGGSYTATYTVGALGAGGSAGANNGSAGGATTFADGTYSLSAGGGNGGSGATAATSSPNVWIGGTTGSSSGGDFNCNGSPGQLGVLSSQTVVGGIGGTGMYGAGAPAVFINNTNSGSNGNAAGSYGSGGGGAASRNNAVNRAGGNGSAGIIIVWEYS